MSLLSVQSIFGLALILLGFTMLLIGQITLRRFHSSTLVIKEDHEIITHGIYRFMRHPIYLGVILVAIGVPVYVSSLDGLLSMSVLIPIFLIRIRIEERMLIDEFGEATMCLHTGDRVRVNGVQATVEILEKAGTTP